MCRKMSQWGRRRAWLHRELELELREKRLWKKRQDALEDYKNVVRLCRKVRKVKPQLEISLATVVIGNKKYFYKYISNKRNARERISILYCV